MEHWSGVNMNRHIMIVLCAVLLLGSVSEALGGSFADGSFMFKKWSADGLAEAQAIVTSQVLAGMILTGQRKFDDTSSIAGFPDACIVVRVRALSNQTIWGDLTCIVQGRSVTIPVTHIGANSGWAYFVFNFRGAGITNPEVYVRWNRIYAK